MTARVVAALAPLNDAVEAKGRAGYEGAQCRAFLELLAWQEERVRRSQERRSAQRLALDKWAKAMFEARARHAQNAQGTQSAQGTEGSAGQAPEIVMPAPADKVEAFMQAPFSPEEIERGKDGTLPWSVIAERLPLDGPGVQGGRAQTASEGGRGRRFGDDRLPTLPRRRGDTGRAVRGTVPARPVRWGPNGVHADQPPS